MRCLGGKCCWCHRKNREGEKLQHRSVNSSMNLPLYYCFSRGSFQLWCFFALFIQIVCLTLRLIDQPLSGAIKWHFLHCRLRVIESNVRPMVWCCHSGVAMMMAFSSFTLSWSFGSSCCVSIRVLKAQFWGKKLRKMFFLPTWDSKSPQNCWYLSAVW